MLFSAANLKQACDRLLEHDFVAPPYKLWPPRYVVVDR